MKAENLPFADDEFDVATAIEVLEHVPEPEHTLAEMARVALSAGCSSSVPREPLWRGLNMARGAYWKDLGNTPGHLNHWSKRSFVRLLVALRDGRRGPVAVPVDDAARPALARHCAAGAPAARLRPRRADPEHRDRGDRALHVRLLRRSPPTSSTRSRPSASTCCGR